MLNTVVLTELLNYKLSSSFVRRNKEQVDKYTASRGQRKGSFHFDVLASCSKDLFTCSLHA